MAIEHLIFGDADSKDYNIEVFFKDIDHTPKRVYERIEVPGRNGAILIDEKRYEDVPVAYDCVALNDADRSAFVNALAAQIGYHRLQDSFNSDEFYSAVFDGDVDPNMTAERDRSTFTIYFTRAAQRFLASGENAVTMGEWGNTETASGSIASFKAKLGDAAKSLVVDINPVQDLNGYDKPWVGGTGKNKLPYPYYDNSQTKNGITFTVNSDGTIKANGTATAESTFYLLNNQSLASIGLTSGTYALNGCPSDGSSSTYRIQIRQNGAWREETGSGLTFTYDASSPVNDLIRIDILSGATVNDIVFKPMIRLSSVSDATYEPYENICPISGYDSVVVSRTGKNLLPYPWNQSDYSANGLTFTDNGDGSVSVSGIASATTWYNFAHMNQNILIPLAPLTVSVQEVLPSGVSVWLNFRVDGSNKYGATISGNNKSATSNPLKQGALRCFIQVESGTNLTNGIVIKPMVRFASDTDSTYEPYNGNTYNISFSSAGTVYGGTLDVTTGVLTVDRAFKTFNGSEAWEAINQGYRLSVSPKGKAHSTKNISNWLTCATSDPTLDPNSYNFTVGNFLNVGVPFSSVSELKTYLGANNLQVAYELDTPTTVQLTAQQVFALAGTNNVWANSGDVSVEYGRAPNALANPTLFESSPLLEMEGSGSVSFNGYNIDIGVPVIGNVPLSYIKQTLSYFLRDVSALNAGDAITVSGLKISITNEYDNSRTLYQVTDAQCTGWSGCYLSGETYGEGGTKLQLRTYFPDFSFRYGTAWTKTVTSQCSVHYYSPFSQFTAGVSITVSYDGSRTITISYTAADGQDAPQPTSRRPSINLPKITGYSTKEYDAGVIYCDCELGEFYRIENGEIISMNHIGDLGSDLPKLASGVNEVTYDNTITSLKIYPRWWKV